jgi:MoaA/NifB/PqqE/SkfB family radical SAM enzyme
MSEITPIQSTKTRTKLSEVVPLDTPFTVQVDPTSRCNFKCVYCFHSWGRQEWEANGIGGTYDMSMETFRKLVEQLMAFPQQVKRVTLCGWGEPLLNKNLPEMIRLVKETRAARRVVVISNGSLLTQEMSDALIDAGLDDLRISLQGLSAKKYKKICGVEIDYEKFYENLRYYFEHKKEGQMLSVKMIDVALDEGETEKFYRMFDGISDRMYVEICHYAENVAFTAGLKTDTLDRRGGIHPPRTVCPQPFFTLMVYNNGDVQPCCCKGPLLLGNIHSKTMKEMFTGEEMREFWKMQLRGERGCNAVCAGCEGPNDLSMPEDVLDSAADEILARMEK